MIHIEIKSLRRIQDTVPFAYFEFILQRRDSKYNWRAADAHRYEITMSQPVQADVSEGMVLRTPLERWDLRYTPSEFYEYVKKVRTQCFK